MTTTVALAATVLDEMEKMVQAEEEEAAAPALGEAGGSDDEDCPSLGPRLNRCMCS